MKISRLFRLWPGSALATIGIACVAALGVTSGDALAQAKPLKKVRIAVGTTVFNVSYPWLSLPLSLDYWKADGYDVEILPVGASLQALQQMVAGNAEFAQINSSVVIQGNAVNDLPVRVVMNNGVIDWALSVPEDSPVKSPQDLKGKTIGVFSLATGGIAFMRAYLRQNGMDPDKDVQLVALGLGAPPVEALRTNKVQALLFWAAAQATFENAGLKLRYLRGADWRKYPDFTFATMQKTVDADPAIVEAIARGAAKATAYVFANPDCARKLHWARFPNTKPTGADEATLVRWDMNAQKAQTDSMKDAFEMNGGKLYGNATADAYSRIQNFMLEAKQIQKTIPANNYLVGIPGFWEKINNFDAAAVRAQAANCPIK